MKNLVLFFVALFLFGLFAPIGFLIVLVLPKEDHWEKVQKYLFRIAVAIDQAGNVVCADLFNAVLVKKNAHPFGDEDETISSVIGKNKLAGKLTVVGWILDKILSKLDSDHSIKSIEQLESCENNRECI